MFLIGLHFIHFLYQLSQTKTLGILFMSILDGIAYRCVYDINCSCTPYVWRQRTSKFLIPA